MSREHTYIHYHSLRCHVEGWVDLARRCASYGFLRGELGPGAFDRLLVYRRNHGVLVLRKRDDSEGDGIEVDAARYLRFGFTEEHSRGEEGNCDGAELHEPRGKGTYWTNVP